MPPPRLIITAIQPQQRRRGRVSVFVNDEFVLGLDERAAAELGWWAGKEITAAQLKQAQEEREYRAARAAAETYLGYRARSEQEIVRKLQQKGYSPGAVADTLRRLRLQGYINDEDFAARYVESGSNRKLGRRRLVMELKRKGIEPEVAEAAIQPINDETERDLALDFARRRAASMTHLDAAIRKRRIFGALQRRGFSSSTIRITLSDLFDPNEGE